MKTQYQQENIRLHDMLEQKMKVISQLQQKNEVIEKALDLFKEENNKLTMLNQVYKENSELSEQTHEALIAMVKTFIEMTLNEKYSVEETREFATGLSKLTMFRGDSDVNPEVETTLTEEHEVNQEENLPKENPVEQEVNLPEVNPVKEDNIPEVKPEEPEGDSHELTEENTDTSAIPEEK